MNRFMRAGSLALALSTSIGTVAWAQATTAPDKADKAPDNTGTNKRDRANDNPTADDQKNNKSDVQVAAEIRRAVVKDKSLSVYAHNIKIVAQDGKVTLKGPVHSDAEKTNILGKAAAVVGQSNVTDQIEVKP